MRVEEATPGMVKETIATDEKVARVTLTIDQDIMSILKDARLDINQLFILLAMHDEKYSLLDQYDEANTRKDILVYQYQDLHIHGFLEESEGECMYQLSEKGKSLAERIQALFEPEGDEKEYEKKFKKMCEEYLLLFPNIKLPSGKAARVNIVDIEKRMRVFIRTFKARFKKDYGFILTHEDILMATKNYVTRYARDNYRFMATSAYFIQKKDTPSALADEIISVKQGLDKAKTNITVQ